MAPSDGSSGGLPDRKDYKVGYKRPPKEHCFRKGTSGNPSGKRKDRATTTETAKDLILREIYRHMKVREGDKVIELPAIQAAMRTHMMNAAKGDRKALLDALGLVLRIEADREDEQMSFFATALNYKAEMEKEIARRQREGIVAPDPVPHPDDIIIDPRTGSVEITGPIDEREKAMLDDTKREHAELLELLRTCADAVTSTRSQTRETELAPAIRRIRNRLRLLDRFIGELDGGRSTLE